MAAAPQAAGMDKAALKKPLSVSKKEPVNCAMAAGADANTGLLLLDKIKPPPAFLRDAAKDAVPPQLRQGFRDLALHEARAYHDRLRFLRRLP